MNKEEKVFDQNKYIQEYRKSHYKQFKAELKKDDFEKIDKILKEKNLNKTQFILIAAEIIKKNYN